MSEENLSVASSKRGVPKALIGVIVAVLVLAVAYAAYVRVPQVYVPPIANAAANGDQEKVLKLLREGANPDERDGNGVSPLQYALLNGNIAVADTLCVAGARVDAKDNNGKTIMDHLQAPLKTKDSIEEKKRKIAIEWLKKQTDQMTQPRTRPSIGT
ncbi:MAG: ankyrin repeat domain-containing protein [Fimbriimonadaceae bacterium]|nr:ankyrin repeat domain-containing protein [Fimbriimonadaceae bacterium]